jgi:chemosensory pili system protein ChpC
MVEAVTAPREIRGLMIPVTNGRVLLPNATVAEVIGYSIPDRGNLSGPEWLLGRVNWRGWRLPLVSFSLLAGMALDERTTGARVTVLKALSMHPRMPYIAMLAQGFPRLTTLSAESLVPIGEGLGRRPGVLMDLMVRDDQAMVPDLDQLERMVLEALGFS